MNSILILLLGCIPLLVIITITWGIGRTWGTTDEQPPVTIVICARDEEKHLFDTLMSLATQDYPQDQLELILVNHLSKDRTGEIMDVFSEDSPIPTRVFHIHEEDPVLKGKVHALTVALDHVETEIVMLTDGDCFVPSTWVSTIAKYFTEHVAAVNAQVTVGREGKQDTSIARLQHVDHRYYLGMLAGLSGLRAPSGAPYRKRDMLPLTIRRLITPLRPAFAIGNNLAFRMSAYREVGGYRAIGPTLVEDFALMNEIGKKTRMQLAVIPDPGARIWTTPLESMRDIWQQKRRWASAMNHFNPLSTILFFNIFIGRVAIPWLTIFYPLQGLLLLTCFALVNIMIIERASRRTEDKIRIIDILVQEFFQILLTHLLMFASIIQWPVIWKGQKYHHRFGKRSA